MQLASELREQLIAVVHEFIGMNPDVAVVRTLLGNDALKDAPPAGSTSHRYAVWMVELALRRPTPETFIKVVQTVDMGGRLVAIHTLVAEIQADGGVWTAEVVVDLWAPVDWPFVDRDALRTALDAMAQGAGPAALSIEGSAGFGKRAVSSYIEQLAQSVGSFVAMPVELRREAGGAVLADLVTDLRVKLRLDADVSTTHSEPERQGEILARDLALEAFAAPKPVWLIANVVDASGVEAGVMRFIDELLLQLGNIPELGSKLRVVLLSESASSLALTQLPAAQNRHVLPEIDRDAVARWLTATVPGRPGDLYGVAADRVFNRLQELQPQPPDRLRVLALGCMKAHQALVAAP